jgi:hypothetical protein
VCGFGGGTYNAFLDKHSQGDARPHYQKTAARMGIHLMGRDDACSEELKL